jgi:hypothetical protein
MLLSSIESQIAKPCRDCLGMAGAGHMHVAGDFLAAGIGEQWFHPAADILGEWAARAEAAA